MSKLSDKRIALALYRAGFPLDEIFVGVAVALAESDGDPLATNKNKDARHTTDYGLMQINSFWQADKLANHDWRDPDQNARMAYLAWREVGGSWSPWNTWKHDSHVKFLARGRAAHLDLFSYRLTRYLLEHHAGPLESGPDVAQLQRSLSTYGAITVDGLFGSATTAAVKHFQDACNVTVDGVVGPQTARKLHWTTARKLADG